MGAYVAAHPLPPRPWGEIPGPLQQPAIRCNEGCKSPASLFMKTPTSPRSCFPIAQKSLFL